MDDFKDVLYKLWEKHEYSTTIRFAELGATSTWTNFWVPKDIHDAEKISMVICFFIEAYYYRYFTEDFKSITDIRITLNTDKRIKGSVLIKLFESLIEDLSESQIMKVQSDVFSCHLENYSSLDNDIILREYIIDKLPFDKAAFNNTARQSDLEIFINTHEQLGVFYKAGTLLVRGDNTFLTKKVLSGDFIGWKGLVVFYPMSLLYWQIITIITAFPHNKNIQCLDFSSNEKEVFPFETTFGGIIYFAPPKSHTVSFNQVCHYLEEDGFGLIFNQSVKFLIDKNTFLSNSFPIIFENKNINEKVYLCIKNSIPSDSIRICNINVTYYEEIDYCVKNYTQAIKEEKYTNNYQKLSKSDFLHANDSDISYDNIRRPVDQIGFIHTELSQLVRVKTDSILYGRVDENRIVDKYNLSSNPFNLSIPDFFYLDNFNFSDSDKEFYKEVNMEVRKNGYVILHNPKKYEKKLVSILNSDNYSADEEVFINNLTCRVCMKPTILMAGNRILKVNASPQSPVCYRAYHFFDDVQGLTGFVQIKEIEIRPEYDEDFVLYQITQVYKGGKYILSLDDKQEQHNYYLGKLDEYKLANADMIKLIRQETVNTLSSEIHSTKHIVSNRLSDVQNIISRIIRMLKRGEIDNVDDIIADLTFAKQVASKTTDDLILLADIINEKQAPINIYTFLNGYAQSIIKKNYRISIDIDNNLKEKLCYLGSNSTKMAFDNIILNAERHAFNDDKEDYVLAISAKKINNVYVEIRFANNGTPPDSSLTEEGFFADGITAGKNANTGHGGALIKKYIERQNGNVHLIKDDEKFPFIIKIQIPFYYE